MRDFVELYIISQSYCLDYFNFSVWLKDMVKNLIIFIASIIVRTISEFIVFLSNSFFKIITGINLVLIIL